MKVEKTSLSISGGEDLFCCSQMELVSILNFDKFMIAVLVNISISVSNELKHTLYRCQEKCRKKANKKSQKEVFWIDVEKNAAEQKWLRYNPFVTAPIPVRKGVNYMQF